MNERGVVTVTGSRPIYTLYSGASTFLRLPTSAAIERHGQTSALVVGPPR